jgi:hypothetical protein
MKLLWRLVTWLRSSLTISTRPFGIRKVLIRSKRYRSTFGWERGTFLIVANVPVNERVKLVLRRLDLTAPTRYMGPRKLLKEGTLLKSKSRRRLYAFLCSDILVLTDESMKTLYRMVGNPHSAIFLP